MSCVTFLTPAQRAALTAAAAEPRRSLEQIRAEHPVPAVTPGKLARLRQLAADSDPAIRQAAATAPHTPPDVLATLAGDPHVAVRCCVARNEHAGPELLRALAADPSGLVRGWVAANRHCPEDLLDRLAGDGEATVRAVVAWNRRWDGTGDEAGRAASTG